jgi:chlorite dismutase
MSTVEKSVLVSMINQRVIDAGELRISRTSLGKSNPEKRYLIYLPLNRNYLWKILHEKNAKLRVFIEIPSEGLNSGERGKGKEPEEKPA